MNIDTTATNGVARISSASNNTDRNPSNVVPINSTVSIRSEEPKIQPTSSEVSQAVESVNKYAQQTNRNLEFSVGESTGRVIITVREAETGNIIRQIPPEEVLAIAELINENLNNGTAPLGVLIADKV